jgi:ribosomal protein S18 acetylase RimI-like enzyme
MSILPLEQAHVPALMSLCAQALPFDQFDQALLQRRIWHDPGAEPAYRLAYELDGRLVGVAVGVRRSDDRQPSGGLLLLAVDPEYRRRAIATQLLDTLEARMHADRIEHVAVGGTAPNFFWPGLDIRYTPAYCLLVGRGYEVFDMRLNMHVDLAARAWDASPIEEALEDSDIVIRRLEAGDRPAFSAWLRSSWSEWWHDEGMNAYANDPFSGFIAVRDGRICAFAVYNVEGFAGHFGPTGTDEIMRGRGIATALFYRCMRDLQQRGLEASEIVWVGPIAYYARIAGATAHRTFWAMRKRL